MSRRTFPRYLVAGLLAATLSPPSPAQMPTAPPPRPKPATAERQFELYIETVPAVRCEGQTVTVTGPGCCAMPAAAPAGQLTGTFYREMPGTVISFTFSGSTCKAVVSVNADGTKGTITLTADCAVTKDGTVHGVVTGADVELDPSTPAGPEYAEASHGLQQMIDQPFAFRTKPCDGGLMVSGVRIAGGQVDQQSLAPFNGKYKPAANGTAPAAKPMKSGPTPVRVCEPSCPLPGAVVPAGLVPPPVAGPIYGYPPMPGNGPVLSCPPPMPGSGPVLSCPPPPPVAGVTFVAPPAMPAGVGQMMAQTFGEMMGTKPGAMTLPNPKYLQHSPHYFSPDPAFPLPREQQMSAPAWQAVPCPPAVTTTGFAAPASTPMVAPVRAEGSAPVGSWHREVGPIAYGITVKDRHLTLTMKVTEMVGEKKVAQVFTLTGDYHVTRDGSNLVGILTGADVTVEGSLAEDAPLDHAAKFPKLVTDKPFALSFRVYDGVLVIGNVRLPDCDEGELSELFGLMAGRYAAGEMPKPAKATKPAAKPTPNSRSALPTAADPNVRMQQLLFQSEDIRNFDKSWGEFWQRVPGRELFDVPNRGRVVGYTFTF